MSAAHSAEGSRRTSHDTAPQGAPPDSLVADVIATFMLTVSSIGFTISMVALIFGGVLESGISRAVGSFVVGCGVMAIMVAWRSQVVPVATFLQDGPGLMVAAVVAEFVASERADIADVFVLLVVTMLATSIAMGLLAHFRLGNVGRYVPTSVVAAFAGGTGWLLFRGGFDVMTTSNLHVVDVKRLLSLDVAKFWLPGVVIGVAAWRSGRSRRPGLAVGAIVATSLAVFYVVVALASSIDAVQSGGWLLGPLPDAGGTALVTPDEFRGANWSGIARTIPAIIGVVLLTCVSQLLHLTGIRSEVAPRLDIDAELRTSAKANLVAAFFGVTPGFQGFGYTVFLHRLGATRRYVALISGGLVVIFGLVGISTVAYVPRLLIGALLIMIGMALLEEWVRGITRSSSIADQLLGVGIVGIVAWFGLMPGIGLGLVAACGIFIVRYSRVDPVRPADPSTQLRGQIDLSPGKIEESVAAHNRPIVLELRGFLFFGSLATLEDHVREAVLKAQPSQSLVLDFANVTGIDSSGCQAVARLIRELSQINIVMWIAVADAELRKTLVAAEPDLANHDVFHRPLDIALEPAAGARHAVPSPIDLLETCGHQIPWSELGNRKPTMAPRAKVQHQHIADEIPMIRSASSAVSDQGIP